MTAAFGLVAALAWNAAITDGIKALGLEQYGPWLYAILITILAVVMIIWISRVAAKLK